MSPALYFADKLSSANDSRLYGSVRCDTRVHSRRTPDASLWQHSHTAFITFVFLSFMFLVIVFTPQTRTRQDCLALSVSERCGQNWRQAKTVSKCRVNSIECRGLVKTVVCRQICSQHHTTDQTRRDSLVLFVSVV